MKNKMTKVLGLGIILAAFSTGVNAQLTGATASDKAEAAATIVTPISILKKVDMNFGNVAISATVPGTVVLDFAGSRLASGGASLPVSAGTVTSAMFQVDGEGTYGFDIDYPSTINLKLTGNPDMVVTISSEEGTSSVLVAGTKNIKFGGSLAVAAAQPAGLYQNVDDFVVTVVYN